MTPSSNNCCTAGQKCRKCKTPSCTNITEHFQEGRGGLLVPAACVNYNREAHERIRRSREPACARCGKVPGQPSFTTVAQQLGSPLPPCGGALMHGFILFFLMYTILKVFIEFVTIFLLFYVLVFLAARHVGSWSLTRDPTCTPCPGRQSLHHLTAREVSFLISSF